MIPGWAFGYVGLPFEEFGRDRKGLDCWGLVRLVLHEQFGVDVPSYIDEYENTNAAAQIGAAVTREGKAWPLVTEPRVGDVLKIRMMGEPMHVGLVLDRFHMLHIEYGVDALIEDFTGVRWKNRVLGIHRHPAMG